jgi:DNA-binding response OmpR family regulator
MKILLVEDAPIVLEYETQILRRAGHTVRATDNGDTAATKASVLRSTLTKMSGLKQRSSTPRRTPNKRLA